MTTIITERPFIDRRSRSAIGFFGNSHWCNHKQAPPISILKRTAQYYTAQYYQGTSEGILSRGTKPNPNTMGQLDGESGRSVASNQDVNAQHKPPCPVFRGGRGWYADWVARQGGGTRSPEHLVHAHHQATCGIANAA